MICSANKNINIGHNTLFQGNKGNCPMKITDESKVFYLSVYSVISKIPYGKVTSYGMYFQELT